MTTPPRPPEGDEPHRRLAVRDLLRALDDFRRTWPQLALCHLLANSFMVVVAGPVIGALLLLFLSREEDGVLTDFEIATYLLDPVTLVAGLLLAAVFLGVTLARIALFLVIGFGATEDRRVTYAQAFRYVLRRSGRYEKLAAHALVRVALVSLPFLAVVGAAYLALLREHDINYYLTNRPPEFRWTVRIAFVALGAGGLVVARMFAGWILALPMLLFEDVGGREALRRSWAATEGRRRGILAVVVGWLAASFLLSTFAAFLVGQIGGRLIPSSGGGVGLLAFGLGATMLVGGVLQIVVQFVTSSLWPLLVVRLYRSFSEVGTLRPEVAPSGSLGDRATFQVPGKAFLAFAAVAPIGVALGAYAAVDEIGTAHETAVIAHRGACAWAPENTMAAFERAAEDGTDWVELDVQESAEGEVIVAHDSDFMKQAGVALKVWQATAEALAGMDIGSWFDPEFADERVPTLRQVLEWARGRVGVVIELKYYGHAERLEERVVAIVEENGTVDGVMIMSLHRPGLRTMASIRPEWTRGLLNTASVGDLTKLDVDFLALNAAAATTKQIRRAHQRGLKVYVWTINDPVRMSILLSRGVDGIITDDPALARSVLELREDLSPVGRLVLWAAGETGFLPSLDEVSRAGDA